MWTVLVQGLCLQAFLVQQEEGGEVQQVQRWLQQQLLQGLLGQKWVQMAGGRWKGSY